MRKIEYDEAFSFLTPWSRVREHAVNLERELHKETAPGHSLYSLKVRAIAQRIDTDDVLFEVDSPDFRYAVVHLSWSDEPECDPRWPKTEVFATFKNWAEINMMADSQPTSDE